MSRPQLIAVSGPARGQSFPLRRTSCTVGRHPESDVQLLELAVSRNHCELVQRGGEASAPWLLRDLESRYGTFVNGQPVGERALAHGDLVQVAGSLLLFLLEEPLESDAALPAPGDDGALVAQSTIQRRLEDNPFLSGASPPARELEVAAAEQAALLKLCTAAQAAVDVAALGAVVLEHLLARLPAERGALLLAAPGAAARPALDELRLVAARQGQDGGAPCPPSRTVLARVLEENVALVCADPAADPRLRESESLVGAGGAASGGGRAVLCAPLGSGARVLGALYLEARPGQPFCERHLDLALATAALAAMAAEKLAQLEWLRGENRRLRGHDEAARGMVGESPAMRRLHAMIRRVAATSSTVLIRGESGTGKEVCAQAIHAASARADAPFIAINCATLSETLLESELFGHEKGAFTGAVARKIGKVELAHTGTLFLDELGELPPSLQARLLRVLQEREIDRVGGARPIAVDVRVIAATNRDLEAAMRAGRFREDLFYRLNVVTLATPALRERREDIPLLARHFARSCAERVGRQVVGISEEARAALTAYDWPGNVRQLGNVIERALVLGSDAMIQLDDLPEEVLAARPPAAPGDAAAPGADFHETILATKRRLIAEAYDQAGHDHQRAAALLGVHANSLHRLIRNLGLKTELGKERE